MLQIVELLIEEKLQENALSLGNPIEVTRATVAERLDTGKPRRRRSLEHMMPYRQGAGESHDPEQPRTFEINPAILSLEATE